MSIKFNLPKPQPVSGLNHYQLILYGKGHGLRLVLWVRFKAMVGCRVRVSVWTRLGSWLVLGIQSGTRSAAGEKFEDFARLKWRYSLAIS